MALLDMRGEPRIILTVPASGTPHISLSDRQGVPRLNLHMIREFPMITFSKPDGSAGVTISTDDDFTEVATFTHSEDEQDG